MQPRHILSTVIAIYIAGFGYLTVWTTQGLAASRPVSLAVKGVSTDNTSSDALLASAVSPVATVNSYPNQLTADKSNVLAGQYVLYDVESGRAVVKSSPTLQPVAIASTTKLFTAHVVSKHVTLDEIVTVSVDAANQDPTGSMMGIHSGEKISVQNLLYGMLLVSGNDAAHALAEYVGGKLLDNPAATSSEKLDRFMQEMNEEAAQLHMNDSHFLDPAGFNDEGRSTAFDLAKMASIDLQDSQISPVLNTNTITVYSQNNYYRYNLHNSDRLIADMPYMGTLGGKTGFTPTAGHCLVSAAKRDGHTLIAVILDTTYTDNDASAREAKKLLDYGFTNLRWQ